MSLREPTGTLRPQNPNPSTDIAGGHYRVPAAVGALGGMIVGLLPGLGAANVATILSPAVYKGESSDALSKRRYVVTTSAINVADTLFGIGALYLLGRARSGASIAIDALLPDVSWRSILALVLVMAGAGWGAYRLIWERRAWAAVLLNRLNYRALTYAVIGLIVSLVVLTTGPWGLVILAGTTLLGMVAPVVGARRAHAMGIFLVPTMLYYSGWQAHVVSWLQLDAVDLPAPAPSLMHVLIAISTAVGVAAALYLLTGTRGKASAKG